MQQMDEPIEVEAMMQNKQLQPQRIDWQNRNFVVIGLGRQWTDTDGRHILIENHDGSRMEIVYSLEAGWRLQRYWSAAVNV